MWPLRCGFRPRYLTALGWNDISCVGPGKANIGALVHTTDYKTSNLLSRNIFFCKDSGELKMDFGSWRLSFSIADVLIKQTLDWSSSKAYTIILLFGLHSWWNPTGTIRECERNLAWLFILRTSLQWHIGFLEREACLEALLNDLAVRLDVCDRRSCWSFCLCTLYTYGPTWDILSIVHCLEKTSSYQKGVPS